MDTFQSRPDKDALRQNRSRLFALWGTVVPAPAVPIARAPEQPAPAIKPTLSEQDREMEELIARFAEADNDQIVIHG